MSEMELNGTGLSQEFVTAASEFDDMSPNVAKKMHWVSSVIVGSICVVFGVIGNSLSIAVWRKKSMRSSSGVYLTAQAASNIGLLISFFLVDSLIMIEPKIKTMYAFGVFYSYVGYPVFYLCVVGSIWVTVGVTVDRYILVCWIGKAKTMCNERRATGAVGLIYFVCFFVNIPHFHTYYPLPPTQRKADDSAFALTAFGKSESGKHYEFWVHCMFLVLVPWLTIFVLNIFIILRIWRVHKKTKTCKSKMGKEKNSKMEEQMTRLLLTVTFTFLILLAMQCVTQCFFMMQPAMANLQMVDEAFSVAKLGLVINSTVNIFLYCFSGRLFRKELFKILHICYTRKHQLKAPECDSNESDPSVTGSGYDTMSTGRY